MDFECEEVIILLVTKTLPDLGNGLKPLGRPLRKVVGTLAAFIGLQGVELEKFFQS